MRLFSKTGPVGIMAMLLCARLAACDLCAVYRDGDTRGEYNPGLVLGVAEQFIPYRTAQVEGHEVTPGFREHVDSSITHVVVGYNFSRHFGISLNTPFTHFDFKRWDFRYPIAPPGQPIVEEGTETGLGDLALIGRLAVFQKTTTDYSFLVNLLGGVKFPTGDDQRLEAEMEQTRIYDSLLPPNTPHDPLGHSISSVHQHALALGSGSFDGIFGVTANASYDRWFFDAQFQYYLRTEGSTGFRYGDELMLSGGPGALLLWNQTRTLALQANAVYDRMDRDQLGGRTSTRTGSTAWYLGPQLNFSWKAQLSANLGVDVPLSIDNGGYQSVPDYRLHGGVSWRF